MAKQQATREKRSFKMHKELLVSVIKRQAGSLWKAVVEGVMNAGDAGASECKIDLSQQMVIIKDDGKGFRSREEIEKFFETFGQPHEAAEEKVYGQFRMGRGQLFAYGRNTWRTGTFEMVVDIEKDGLDYTLRDGLENQPGCTITVELYNPLTHTEYAAIVDELESNVQYVRFACMLNDKRISKDPATQTWDMETAEADIRFNRNRRGLTIYNQGIKVCTWSDYKLGVSGDVVSKKALTVNFARNDVMSNCPVWKAIQAAIMTHSNAQALRAAGVAPQPATQPQRTRRRPTLTEADRIRLVTQARDLEISSWQVATMKVFQKYGAVANVTLNAIHKIAKGRVTVPTHYVNAASQKYAAQYGVTCYLNRNNLTRWGQADGEALVREINRITGAHGPQLMHIPATTVERSINEDYRLLEPAMLTRSERLVLDVVKANIQHLRYGAPHASLGRNVTRSIRIGDGPSDHWTDGATVVVLSRDMVNWVKVGPVAWVQYGLALIHECCHRESSMTEDHEHNEQFMQDYLEWSAAVGIGYFAYACATTMPKIAERANIKLNARELQAVDTIARAQATPMRYQLEPSPTGPSAQESTDVGRIPAVPAVQRSL